MTFERGNDAFENVRAVSRIRYLVLVLMLVRHIWKNEMFCKHKRETDERRRIKKNNSEPDLQFQDFKETKRKEKKRQ